MHPRKLPPFIFLPFLIFSVAVAVAGENFSFDFPTFNFRNLTFLGDSHIRDGVVGLTRDLLVPTSSSGAVLYSSPLLLFDPESNVTASFSTRFTFLFSNPNPLSPSGDGMSFFLVPNNHSSPNDTSFFIAVEFDSKRDLQYNDPDDHHVGLDISSLVSIKTADPVDQGVDFKSGAAVTAWVDYKNDQKALRVYLSYSAVFKPDRPVLDVAVDLSGYLKQTMFAGFSASTQGSTELHQVLSWSFKTFGFVPKRPTMHPHNVSDTYVIVSPKMPSPARDSGRRRIGLGLGIGMPAAFFFVLTIFGVLSVRKCREAKKETNFKAEVVAGPRQFSYRELRAATGRFHPSRMIGHGAFGTVYKAFFVSSGTVAAVKRSRHCHEGRSEFLAELSIIACLRHKNLVPLQGWCVEKGELLLVYDFMANGSLEQVLYQDSELCNANLLDWNHRRNVAIGLASVLTYMHQECEQQVIHRDIKTGNVLLDGNFNAKLGDFGLAKLMDHDKSPVSTLTAGTMGYLAPEYLQYGKATVKTDAFSYGVVILEIACGRRPIERIGDSNRMVNLVDWVWGMHSEGRIIDATDPRLRGEFDVDEMRKLLLVGLSCANPDSSKRPTMRRVLQILSNEVEPPAVPRVKPSLSFSCGLSLSVDDIVSDCEEDSMCEIVVN